LAPLSRLFSDLIDEGRYGIDANPCLRPGRLIKITSRKKPLKAYDAKQEAAILKACRRMRPDQYALFCTLFWAGLRPGEAWALLSSDVDLKRKRLSIAKTFTDGELHDTPKTGQSRLVEIPDKLVAVLRSIAKQFPKSEILVFPGRKGDYRHQSQWNRKIWTPIVTAAGVPRYPPYATRHTYATRQLECGCSLQWLMHQMGHSSIKITVDTYGHLARGKS
jgi:integrase